jgi:tetratricopeptide (TPR) repeat protein
VDKRLENYGISGMLPEDELGRLGASLLGEKKYAKALDVAQYRVACYPGSADARVSLGDAFRESGKPDKARECFKQALALAPGHGIAAAKLEELGGK